MTFTQEVQHPNGLQLAVPAGFDAQQDEHGFKLTEHAAVRSPRQMSIERVAAAPVIASVKTRKLGEVPTSFGVAELGAGSAGTEYELTAAKAAGTGWIVLSATTQTEAREPDFELAWAVLERARLRQ